MKKQLIFTSFLIGFFCLWGQSQEAGIGLSETPFPQNRIYTPADSGRLTTPVIYFDFAAGVVVLGSGQSLREQLPSDNSGGASATLFGGSNADYYPRSSPGIFLAGSLEYEIGPHLGLGMGLSGIRARTEGYNKHYNDNIKLTHLTVAFIPYLQWAPKEKRLQLALGPAFYWNNMSGKQYGPSSIGKESNATFGAYGGLSATISSYNGKDIRIALRYLHVGKIEDCEPLLPSGEAKLNSLSLGLSLNLKNQPAGR